MIAIVEVGGKQYKVAPQSQIQVDLLDAEKGSEISIDKVLLKFEDNGSNCQVGQPYTGDTIKAKIVDHVKGDKVRVFKFKPKTRYAKTKGHRQNYTILEISSF
ncbi:50S ribosomal protein L21 [Candidatus Peregrinibacteria bacterium]|nr:50S ribosomal protein L21 [Candidatus Peregrinibacteria bacterium]